MKYVDYRNLEEFYSIKDLCRLFGMDKEQLQTYSRKFKVEPTSVRGVYGFKTHEVRKLHNLIYNEDLDQKNTKAFYDQGDPWNG